MAHLPNHTPDSAQHDARPRAVDDRVGYRYHPFALRGSQDSWSNRRFPPNWDLPHHPNSGMTFTAPEFDRTFSERFGLHPDHQLLEFAVASDRFRAFGVLRFPLRGLIHLLLSTTICFALHATLTGQWDRNGEPARLSALSLSVCIAWFFGLYATAGFRSMCLAMSASPIIVTSLHTTHIAIYLLGIAEWFGSWHNWLAAGVLTGLLQSSCSAVYLHLVQVAAPSDSRTAMRYLPIVVAAILLLVCAALAETIPPLDPDGRYTGVLFGVCIVALLCFAEAPVFSYLRRTSRSRTPLVTKRVTALGTAGVLVAFGWLGYVAVQVRQSEKVIHMLLSGASVSLLLLALVQAMALAAPGRRGLRHALLAGVMMVVAVELLLLLDIIHSPTTRVTSVVPNMTAHAAVLAYLASLYFGLRTSSSFLHRLGFLTQPDLSVCLSRSAAQTS